MNFTDSPFEWMMKQKPYVPLRDRELPPPRVFPCKDCPRERGGKCDKCYRGIIRTSGHIGPKL